MTDFKQNKKNERGEFNFRDLDIAKLKYGEILLYLEDKIGKKEKTFCVTLNLDILRLAFENLQYYEVIKNSNLIVADGMPIVWLSRFIKNYIPERTAGSDLVFDFCKLSDKKGYKIFMLGAGPEIADLAQKKLEETMPDIKIVGTYSPSSEEIEDEKSSENIVKMINGTDADILFVALGAPKQEVWVNKYFNSLNPYVIIPCGGSIDFLAGTQKKANKIWGKLGIEWLHRFVNNPKKFFKRYFVHDIPFLLNLITQLIFENIKSEHVEK